MQLSAAHKNYIKRASRKGVEDVLRSRLKDRLSRSEWLSRTNRYRVDSIRKLKRDIKNNKVKSAQLAEYVAASATTHLIDGWTLLSRGVNALMMADGAAATHLGYYAELRAGMSLLAAEGVGVFDRQHVIVDFQGRADAFGADGTHGFIWPCLDHWSNSVRAQRELVGFLSVGGIPLADWLTAFGLGKTSGRIGKKWLESWGLDLRQLSTDRGYRNEVSYRPSRFRGSPSIACVDVAAFLTDSWELLEPSGGGRFEGLDKFLLRRALEAGFKGVTGSAPTSHQQGYERMLDSMFGSLGARVNPTVWKPFLMRAIQASDPVLLNVADARSYAHDGELAMQVLARGMLLLRIATASARSLLQSIGVASPDLAFWWRELGENRGLWQSGAEPVDFTDLWADVEAVTQETTDWMQRVGQTTATLASWRSTRPMEYDSISSYERVLLWGLAS